MKTKSTFLLLIGLCIASIAQTQTNVVINEFMASNEASVSDQDGEYDDWIELFNGASTAIDLSGYYLSDNATNLTKWEIPDGTSIDGQGYLIFWADEDQEQEGLHTNFKLSKAGEVIYLVDPNGEVADGVVFGEQVTDLSAARDPNGVGNFVIKAHTFGLHNDLTSATNEAFSLLHLDVYPNPAREWIQIDFSSTDSHAKLLEVFNLMGARLLRSYIHSSHQLDVSGWSRGVYLLRVDGKSVMVRIQ